jgi:hypothetical protein
MPGLRPSRMGSRVELARTTYLPNRKYRGNRELTAGNIAPALTSTTRTDFVARRAASQFTIGVPSPRGEREYLAVLGADRRHALTC